MGTRQRLRDQLPHILYAIQRDEAAHAGAFAGAEEGFVEHLEPVAERLELVVFADFEDDVLDFVVRGVGGSLASSASSSVRAVRSISVDARHFERSYLE